MEYELKLADGRVARITGGSDAQYACRRFADMNPGTTVVAWRVVRHGLFIL